MLKIQVSGDFGKSALEQLRRDLRPKVLQPALNRVAAKAVAEINRAIPQEFNVKAAEVRNAIDLRKASGGKLEAVIEVFGSASKRGRSMNLIHFLAAVQAAGRAVKVRGAKGKKIDGAFVGNRGRTIFRREGKARLPIKPLQVIGFSQMFTSRRISQRVVDKIRADLPVEIDRALAMVMARGKY